jgi:hypothetical protein
MAAYVRVCMVLPVSDWFCVCVHVYLVCAFALCVCVCVCWCMQAELVHFRIPHALFSTTSHVFINVGGE